MIPYLLLTRYYRVPDNVGIFLKYIIPKICKNVRMYFLPYGTTSLFVKSAKFG